MEPKRLYRSLTNRTIAGVAGGLGEYFDLDPLLIRLIFIILTIAGPGLPLYIVLWIVTPDNPIRISIPRNQPGQNFQQSPPYATGDNSETTRSAEEASDFNADAPKTETSFSTPTPKAQSKNPGQGSLTGGMILIAIGILFLAIEFIPQVTFGNVWPVILIVIGVGLLINPILKRNHNTN